MAAIAVYTAHVVRGGWYLDDWINVALMRDAGGLGPAIDVMNNLTYRPGLSISLVGLQAVAGDAPSDYLAIGVFLTALQASLFYVVLRMLRFDVLVAGMATLIFLVLPCIDATRLWMAAIPIQIAGALYLAGVLVGIRGISAPTAARRVVWHLGAVLLFGAALLTYELIAGVVVVTAILYVVRAGVKAAAWRAALDWSCVAVILYILAQRAVDDRGANTSIDYLLDRAQQMWTPAEQVFRSLIPWSDVLGGVVGLMLLLAGLAGVAFALYTHSAAAPGLLAWLLTAGVSLLFALAGLVMLLPADPYFVPRTTGLGNRVSAFAAFGGVVLLVSLIAVACGGIGALLKRPAAGFAVALALMAITAAALTAREVKQQDPWAQAWDEQIDVLSAINTAVDGRLSPTAEIVTFRHTTFILPADVSVFAYSWDLRGALMNVFRAPMAVGHPWTSGSRCGPDGVVFTDGTGAPDEAAPYRYSSDLLFVDASSATAQRIRDRRSCERAVTALTGVSAPS